MVRPRIYADFRNADSQGRVRLNCTGTIEDLAEQHVELREGMQLTLYSDDLDDQGQLDELLAEGIASFSKEEHCWVAIIDWNAIHHASETPQSRSPVNGPVAPLPSKETGRTSR